MTLVNCEKIIKFTINYKKAYTPFSICVIIYEECQKNKKGACTVGNKKEKLKKAFRDKDIHDGKHYSKKVASLVISAFSVLSCVLAVLLFLFIKHEMSDTDAFQLLVKENYLLSVLILIAICAVQVVVALVPGELVEVAAGYAFGSVAGAIYCMIGISIGSALVILLVRKFGRRLVEAFYPRDKIDSLPILNQPKKRNVLTFILFLIPGTPKDLITYVVGITDMSIPLYLLLSNVARIPSIVMSTISGDALGSNKFLFAVLFYAGTAVVSGIGYLIYKKRFSSKNAPLHEESNERSSVQSPED